MFSIISLVLGVLIVLAVIGAGAVVLWLVCSSDLSKASWRDLHVKRNTWQPRRQHRKQSG